MNKNPSFIPNISSLDKTNFLIKKPINWVQLPFYQKIKYYGENLTHKFSYFVDKLTAKLIVKHICGDKLKVSTVIKVLSDVTDISEKDIKEGYILKSSHGSGWNLVLDRVIDNVNHKINMDMVKHCLQSWNKQYNPSFEKQYSYLNPTFFIEEIINDKYLGKNGNAYVYMLRCINGKPICVNIKLNDKQNYYTTEWKPFYVQELPTMEKPKKLDLMIELASTLSKNFEFVRIDFHIDVNDDIYFSEFTFTPNAGNRVFTNELEMQLGKDWI